MHFTLVQPLLYPFLPTLLYSSPVTFSCTVFHQFEQSHCPPTSWTLRFASLSAAKSQFSWSSLVAHELLQLTKLAFCFFLCYGCLSALCDCMFCSWLLAFPCHPIWQGPQSGNCPDINVPMFQYLYQDRWMTRFHSCYCLSFHLLVRILSSSFTYFPFCTEKVLGHKPLRKQRSILPHILTASKRQLTHHSHVL